MDREEAWVRWALASAATGTGFSLSMANADSLLEEFDKRFSSQVTEEDPVFSLSDLPKWDDILHGVTIEGASCMAQYQDGVNQYVLKFFKNGTPGVVYLNEKTEAQAEYSYQNNAKEYIENGLLQVDDQRTHEND